MLKKMGCAMAKRILPARNENGQNQDDTPATTTGNHPLTNQKQMVVKMDEVGDFSKIQDDPRMPLNVRQIFKITKSWKAIARTMSRTGTIMFVNLFEQNEDLLHLFTRFQHLKGQKKGRLQESMELQEHAATVMSTLDQSINSLNNYDNFVAYLYSIGKLHRKVPGFKKSYFWEIEQPFLKAVKQTLDERCNETIEQIYILAIKFIIETIMVGFGDDQPDDVASSDNDTQRGSSSSGGQDNSNNKPSDASGNNKQDNTSKNNNNNNSSSHNHQHQVTNMNANLLLLSHHQAITNNNSLITTTVTTQVENIENNHYFDHQSSSPESSSSFSSHHRHDHHQGNSMKEALEYQGASQKNQTNTTESLRNKNSSAPSGGGSNSKCPIFQNSNSHNSQSDHPNNKCDSKTTTTTKTSDTCPRKCPFSQHNPAEISSTKTMGRNCDTNNTKQHPTVTSAPTTVVCPITVYT